MKYANKISHNDSSLHYLRKHEVLQVRRNLKVQFLSSYFATYYYLCSLYCSRNSCSASIHSAHYMAGYGVQKKNITNSPTPCLSLPHITDKLMLV